MPCWETKRLLETVGFTPRQAEWIVLVCLHSGLFTRDQVESFLGSSQPKASRFYQQLLDALLSGKPIARDLNTLIRSGCPSPPQIPGSVSRQVFMQQNGFRDRLDRG